MTGPQGIVLSTECSWNLDKPGQEKDQTSRESIRPSFW